MQRDENRESLNNATSGEQKTNKEWYFNGEKIQQMRELPEGIAERSCTERQVCNYVVYADDTTLYIEERETNDMVEQKLQNYQIVLESRDLTNQWSKVVLITNRSGHSIREVDGSLTKLAGYKPPYDRVICKKDDRLLGKQVHATHNARKPVKHRIRIANGVFKQMTESIFKNPRYAEKTKLQVWNGIIRALLTYGLNAVKLTQEENELVDTLTMKHMRVIFNPKDINECNKRPFNNNAKLNDEQRRLKHKQNEEKNTLNST